MTEISMRTDFDITMKNVEGTVVYSGSPTTPEAIATLNLNADYVKVEHNGEVIHEGPVDVWVNNGLARHASTDRPPAPDTDPVRALNMNKIRNIR